MGQPFSFCRAHGKQGNQEATDEPERSPAVERSLAINEEEEAVDYSEEVLFQIVDML